MAQINTREIVLLGITTVTTSGTGADTNMVMCWNAATITLNVLTVSGTLPTIDVYIQKKLGQCAAADVNPGPPTGTAIYDDLLHFAQLTTLLARWASRTRRSKRLRRAAAGGSLRLQLRWLAYTWQHPEEL